MSYPEKRLRSLAGKAVHQYRMIEHGDRILVGLSGGKDSLALLRFLDERRARVPIKYTIAAMHIDLGYDEAADKAALRNYLKSYDFEVYFEEHDYGRRAHAEENRENPCFLCSYLRRKRLFEAARELGCSKVALGHNRDDLIETLLINIFYSGRISTMLPVQPFFKGELTVIRPLIMTPDKEISRVAGQLGFPLIKNGCPSAFNSKRQEVKEIIAELTRKNKKVPANIFRALCNFQPDYLLGRPDPSPFPYAGRDVSINFDEPEETGN